MQGMVAELQKNQQSNAHPFTLEERSLDTKISYSKTRSQP